MPFDRPQNTPDLPDEPRTLCALKQGDVVMLELPNPTRRRGGWIPRPCIVLDVTKTDVLFIPGATEVGQVDTRRDVSRDLLLAAPASLAAAGLAQPVRFRGWRFVRVPLTDPRMRPSATGLVCGRLDRRARRRLTRLKAVFFSQQAHTTPPESETRPIGRR